jgi:hypothetical protein
MKMNVCFIILLLLFLSCFSSSPFSPLLSLPPSSLPPSLPPSASSFFSLPIFKKDCINAFDCVLASLDPL